MDDIEWGDSAAGWWNSFGREDDHCGTELGAEYVL